MYLIHDLFHFLHIHYGYFIILNLTHETIVTHLQTQKIQIYSQNVYILMFPKVYKKGYMDHIRTTTQEGNQACGTHVAHNAVNVLRGYHTGL